MQAVLLLHDYLKYSLSQSGSTGHVNALEERQLPVTAQKDSYEIKLELYRHSGQFGSVTCKNRGIPQCTLKASTVGSQNGKEASQLISSGCSGDAILGCPAMSTQPVAYCTFTFGSRLIPAVGSRILLGELIPQSRQCCEFATASLRNRTFLFSSVDCFTNGISSPYFYVWGEQFFLPNLFPILTVLKK